MHYNSALRDKNDARFLKLQAITHTQLKPITDAKPISHLQMLMNQNRQSSNDYFQTNRVSNTISLLGNHKFTPNSSGTHYYESNQGSNLIKNERPTTNDSRTEDLTSLQKMLVTGRTKQASSRKVDQGTTVENSLSDSEHSSELRITSKVPELDHSTSNQIRIEEFPELENHRNPHTHSNQTLDTIEAQNEHELKDNKKSVLKLSKIQKKNILSNKNKQVQFSNLNDVLIKESLAKVKKQILLKAKQTAKQTAIQKKLEAELNEDIAEISRKTQSQSMVESLQLQSRLAKTSMGFTHTTFSTKFKPQKITPATNMFTNLVNYQVDSYTNSIDMQAELESIRREQREKERRAWQREQSKNNETYHEMKNAQNRENLANLHERAAVKMHKNRTLRTSYNYTDQ